jgi:hypothetical protein
MARKTVIPRRMKNRVPMVMLLAQLGKGLIGERESEENNED